MILLWVVCLFSGHHATVRSSQLTARCEICGKSCVVGKCYSSFELPWFITRIHDK